MLAHSPAVSPIPANLSDRVHIAWIDHDGRLVLRDLTESLDVGVLFEGRAARRFPAWSGKRSFSGWYWCRTTGSMVPFESLLEREAVVVFDFDPSVVEIVAQPFALLWPLLHDGAA